MCQHLMRSVSRTVGGGTGRQLGVQRANEDAEDGQATSHGYRC